MVSAINPLRQPSIVKCDDQTDGLVSADIKLSTSQVYLPPKDEAAEFDDHGVDLAGHVDDKDLVVWRKNNKVGLRFEVTAKQEGPQVVGFGIQYQYTNTVFALGEICHKLDYSLMLYLCRHQRGSDCHTEDTSLSSTWVFLISKLTLRVIK